jgi:predicted acyltransferase
MREKEVLMLLQKKIYKLAACFLLIFGICYLVLVWKIPFGSFSKPNSGFLPKVSGVMFIILAALNVLAEFKKPDTTSEELDSVDWKKAALFVFTCVLYVVLLSTVGYLIGTVISLFLMIKFTGFKGNLIPIITSLAVSLFFYFIFYKLLSVPLPLVSETLLNVLPF